MRSALPVLALLLLALAVLPLAPYTDSTGTTVPAGPAGDGHGWRYGAGAAGPGSAAGQGMRGPGSAGPADPGAGHRHGHPAETFVRQELRRDPFEGIPVRSIRFHGYRRLSGKNILEQEKRQLIYRTILDNPGIGIPALADRTGINLHTLRYHLVHLIQLRKVACVEQGGGYHFFENHGRYDAAGQQRILYGRYPTTSRILGLIAERPGITRGALAEELGLAGPSVTRWTQRLVAGGIVAELRDGRMVRYFPAESPAVMPA